MAKCKSCETDEVATMVEWVTGWGDEDAWKEASGDTAGKCCECLSDELRRANGANGQWENDIEADSELLAEWEE